MNTRLTLVLLWVLQNSKGSSPNNVEIVANILKASLSNFNKTIILEPEDNVPVENIYLAKKLMSLEFAMKVVSPETFHDQDNYVPIAIIPRTESSFEKALAFIDSLDLGTSFPVLVIHDSLVTNIPNSWNNIRMNQQIYFVNLQRLDIIETYTIGGYRVVKTIGRFDQAEEGVGLVPSMSEDWSIDIGKRRNNFFAKDVTAIVAHDPPYSYLRPGFLTTPNHPGSKQLHFANDHAFGLYIDIFDDMANSVNFTYDLFSHVDDADIAWGSLSQNGTFEGLSVFVTNGTIDVFANFDSGRPIFISSMESDRNHLAFLSRTTLAKSSIGSCISSPSMPHFRQLSS